jgi:hypothetical protein
MVDLLLALLLRLEFEESLQCFPLADLRLAPLINLRAESVDAGTRSALQALHDFAIALGSSQPSSRDARPSDTRSTRFAGWELSISSTRPVILS